MFAASRLANRVRHWWHSDMPVSKWVFLGLYVVLFAALLAHGFWFWRDWHWTVIGGWSITWLNLIITAVVAAGPAAFVFGTGTSDLCERVPWPRRIVPVSLAATGIGSLGWGASVAALEVLSPPIRLDDHWLLEALQVGAIFLGIVLFLAIRRWTRHQVLRRVAALALAAAVLELLICVPCHLSARESGPYLGRRTMAGIMTGLTILMTAMGPMIALLFLRPRYRAELESLRTTPRCAVCRYNLTGNVSGVCPECGTPIAAATPVA